jgi:MGT family glycosyltransferase
VDQTDYSTLGKPLIYISLGTILNSQDFYLKCFDAFRSFSGRVVLSIGNKGRIDDLENIPENFIIKNHVNQLEILQHAGVFITHGGMNSVHEGIYYGVPLCVYPFQVEQESVARRVAETGCGIILKDLNSDLIKKSVARLIYEPQFKDNCQKLSASFQRSGGYKTGVDYILDFKKTFHF